MKTLQEMVRKQKIAKTNQRRTCSKPLANKPVNKMSYKTKTIMKETWLYLLCGNGPPCPSFGSTSQWDGVFAYGAMEERGVNGLRGKGSQGTHTGSITIGRE